MNKKHAISIVVLMLGVLVWLNFLPGQAICAAVILLALANLA